MVWIFILQIFENSSLLNQTLSLLYVPFFLPFVRYALIALVIFATMLIILFEFYQYFFILKDFHWKAYFVVA